jgi:hypothetical protein
MGGRTSFSISITDLIMRQNPRIRCLLQRVFSVPSPQNRKSAAKVVPGRLSILLGNCSTTLTWSLLSCSPHLPFCSPSGVSQNILQHDENACGCKTDDQKDQMQCSQAQLSSYPVKMELVESQYARLNGNDQQSKRTSFQKGL